jgi:hypothetical protein
MLRAAATLIILLGSLMPTSPPDPPKPIEKARALEIASKTVAGLSGPHDFVILEDRTVERPFGWVFFYTTRRYVQTGDRQYIVPGTAPLVVHRADGSIEHLATSVPPARAIEIYEKRWLEKQSSAKTNSDKQP